MTEVLDRTEVAIINETDLARINFSGDDGLEKMISAIEKLVDNEVPDTSTPEGRKAIRSFSSTIATTKVALDKHRKDLGADHRDAIKKINEAGTLAVDRLQVAQDKARRPLTEYEARESRRVSDLQARFEKFQSLADVDHEAHVSDIEDRIASLKNAEVGEDWQERQDEVRLAKGAMLDTLETALIAAKERDEKERIRLENEAELERARAENEKLQEEIRQRKQAETERKAKEQRAADEAAAVEKAREEERAAAALRETEAKLAQERAEREAQEAQARADRERQEAEAKAEQAAKEAREQAEKDERDRVAAEKAAEAQRKADEDHRQFVIDSAMTDIVKASGIDADTALKIVQAMIDGHVANVEVKF